MSIYFSKEIHLSNIIATELLINQQSLAYLEGVREFANRD